MALTGSDCVMGQSSQEHQGYQGRKRRSSTCSSTDSSFSANHPANWLFFFFLENKIK
jgi:hypothetical protein